MTISRKISFKNKILISYSILIAFIILVTLYFISSYVADILEKNAIEGLEQLTQRTVEQLDGLFQEMDRNALLTLSNPNIQAIFGQTSNRSDDFLENNPQLRKSIEKSLLSINGTSPNNSAIRIHIFNESGNYVGVGPLKTEQSKIDHFFEYGLYSILMREIEKKNPSILTPHEDYWSSQIATPLFSLLRTLRIGGEIKGIIEVQQPYAKIEKIFKPYDSEKIHAFLATDKNFPAYPFKRSDSSLDYHLISHYFNKFEGKNSGTLKAINPVTQHMEIVIFKRSDYSGWLLYLTQPYEELIAPASIVQTIILYITLGILLISMMVIYFISNQITKPLQQLRASVDQVNFENLTLSAFDSQDHDEIEHLKIAFDEMFHRLENSMDQVVQLRSSEMKAHLLALQSQMNPHFFNNILANISSASEEGDVEKVADMCVKTSSMLRYISTFEENEVKIEEEVNHTLNYLDLMKRRHESGLTFDLQMNEALNHVMIPKLCLQPLVENCFHHGFNLVLPPYTIQVQVTGTEDQWRIQVDDNGHGMDETTKVRLMEKFHTPQQPVPEISQLKLGGLGIINILWRLKILYGKDAIFAIQPSQMGGTQITIGGVVK